MIDAVGFWSVDPTSNFVRIVTVASAIATVIVAVVNLFLLVFGWRSLRNLQGQINLDRQALEASQASAAAANEAVREAMRARTDDQAPRIVVIMEEPEWPPFRHTTRQSMPGGGEPTLLETKGQSEVASATYYLDRDGNTLFWFLMRGVILNEGKGTARVRLDGDTQFVTGPTPLVPGGVTSVPPLVGSVRNREYLIRPGEWAMFEWAHGHTMAEWVDAYKNPSPPNPHGACTLDVVSFDWASAGTIDHTFVLMQARPFELVPGREVEYQLAADVGANVGIVVYPPRRVYRAESELPPEPAWSEVFAEWSAAHGMG